MLRLDAKEREAENKRQHQAQHQTAFAARFGAPYTHSHGEAGRDEDRGIRRAPADVQLVRAHHERGIVPVAVNQVGGEEAAEALLEQNLKRAWKARGLL